MPYVEYKYKWGLKESSYLRFNADGLCTVA